jgi:hypothetical protein
MKVELPPAFVAFGRSTPSSTQDVDEPVLHVNFESTQPQYTLVIDFPTVVDPTNLTNEVISIFGKEFTTGTATEMSATKFTLYSAAVDQTFTAGQEAVVDVNGQKVTVRVIGVNTQSAPDRNAQRQRRDRIDDRRSDKDPRRTARLCA